MLRFDMTRFLILIFGAPALAFACSIPPKPEPLVCPIALPLPPAVASAVAAAPEIAEQAQDAVTKAEDAVADPEAAKVIAAATAAVQAVGVVCKSASRNDCVAKIVEAEALLAKAGVARDQACAAVALAVLAVPVDDVPEALVVAKGICGQ